MNIFNEGVVEEFSKPLSEEVATKAVAWTESVLVDILNEIKAKTSVVSSNYEFALMGDFISGATTVNSEIDIYIAFKSPQLEFNSIKIVDKKLRQFWVKIKRAWELSKEEKKNKKRKKSKKQSKITIQEVENIPSNKYSIIDLKKDILNRLLKALDEKSFVYVNNKSLKIVSRENFGVDINVYPVIASGDDYKLYNDYTAKFEEINFNQFKANLERKIRKAGETYIGITRVLKNMYFNINNYNPSPFFIESVLYNVPDDLFDGYSFYQVFIKVLNYLKNARPENFVSMLDKDKKLFSDKNIPESILSIRDLIKQIDKLL